MKSSSQGGYYNVRKGSVEVLLIPKYRNWTLFLCWPPFDDPFAFDAIASFKGDTFIYVGEERDGATGNDAFFDELEDNWCFEEGVRIPQWFGMHDYFDVYNRRGMSCD
jgi:hypothetical protein